MSRDAIHGISADLMHLAKTLAALGDTIPDIDVARAAAVSPNERGAMAGRLYRERRVRDKIVGSALFGEPAWDLLLDLYACKQNGRSASISDACISAAVPPSTALRHLTRMLAEGLLIRETDTTDGRRSWVRLSEPMAALIDAYLDRVVAARSAKQPTTANIRDMTFKGG